MAISSVVMILGGIFCLILASRGRDEEVNEKNFPELSTAEVEETKILVAVIRRRSLYLAIGLIIVGLISGLKLEPAARIYGLFFILAIFWGNVVPRNRLFRIMNARNIAAKTIRRRGIRF